MFDDEIVVIDDANEHRQADANFQWPIANLGGKVQTESEQKLPTCTYIDDHKISTETRCNRTSCSQNHLKSLCLVAEGISEDDNCICTRDWSTPRKSNTSVTMENIELESLVHPDDLDPRVIGDDVIESVSNWGASFSHGSGDDSSGEISAFCYTPERLVRSREYRILTPSPKYFFESSFEDGIASSPFNESRSKIPRFRIKLDDLIDSSKIGASQLEALLDSSAPEIRVPLSNRRIRRNRDHQIRQVVQTEVSPSKELLEIANRESPIRYETPEPASSSSSTYGYLCNSLGDHEKSSHSVDDTSGIQSNTWSESSSGFQTPVCSSELQTVSTICKCQRQSRGVITQVVTVLEGLSPTTLHPPDINYLIQDRFSPNLSTHDYLTRLALSIEAETDPESLKYDRTTEKDFNELRERLEQLQENSKDMYRDIGLLRIDFQCEERKLDNLLNETSRLHRDMSELRYLDDLLNLLRGELARISRRNWPFVLGHDDYDNEEINLVV
ncbi:uncharacterized protein [Fopius arisanus]|uniref:RpsO protein n=1 Tax=Fopius arisanus TaxID=64838 RepID=A0A0C9RWF2_9HYME|nr:PREDICTED: uncharacterized protein LOC105267638 [Fopius arisanus]